MDKDKTAKLRGVCPEIIEAFSEVQGVVNHFKNNPSWQQYQGHLDGFLNKSQVKVTFAEINSIAATLLQLAEFAEYCLNQCSWYNEPDGGSIQDKAIELKLVELRPINEEDSIDGEKEHYFCKWAPKTPTSMEEK